MIFDAARLGLRLRFQPGGLACRLPVAPRRRPVWSKKKLKFHISAASGLKSGQFNRKRNFNGT